MCDVVTPTMLVTSLVLTAVSTAAGIAGQVMQADQANKATSAQAKYQQQQLDQQKAMQEQQAQDAIARGSEEKNQQQRNASRIMGEQRSMLAASGVEMDSGSALTQIVESAEEAQHDSNIITQNASREAWGYQVGANNTENQKSLVAATAKNTIAANTSAAAWGAGTTLLSGLSKGVGQYSDWKGSQPAEPTYYDRALGQTVKGVKPAFFH